MKFRGKMVDTSHIQSFSNIFHTVGRVSKSICLRITTSHMHFIMPSKLTSEGTGLWCSLDQTKFFEEFNMEGISAEFNEIHVELSSDFLLKVLKSSSMSTSLKLKLTKKHLPCLTIEFELPSFGSAHQVVVHDIPASVIPRRLWQEYREPTMPQFHLSVYMPHFKTLANVLERMKNLGSHVVLIVNKDGATCLKVETDKADVTTHFGQLEKATVAENKFEEARVRVDIRKLFLLFSGMKLGPLRIICNVANEKMLHLFILRDDTTLQYLLPSISV